MLMNDEVPGDSISGGRLAAAVAPPVRLLTYLWIGNEWTLSGVTKGEEIVVDRWFKCGWVNGDQSQEDGRGQPLAMVTVERIMSNYHRRPHWHLHTIKYMKKRSGNDSSIGILQKRSPSSIRMRWEQKMKNQQWIVVNWCKLYSIVAMDGDTFTANSYSFMYHQSHIIRLIKHQAEEEGANNCTANYWECCCQVVYC